MLQSKPAGSVRRKILALLVGSLCLLFAGTARAAETHVFDPILSLTGDCSVSEVDPAPDPGSCPGTPGVDHPAESFSSPRSITTDSYGDIYVASFGKESQSGAAGRIDVFNPKGFFITEIADSSGPKNLAVDSKGTLYVFNYRSFGATVEEIARYSPTPSYDPEKGEISYESAVPAVKGEELAFGSITGIAVNPINDRLFVHFGRRIAEYGSAAEENKLIDGSIGKGILRLDAPTMGLAIDVSGGRIYATDHRSSPDNFVIRAFELSSPHGLAQTIDGSTTPAGKFTSDKLSVAIDEGTGHVFVYDEEAAAVYEFDKEGQYVATLKHTFKSVFGGEIAIDNGAHSPNGVLNPVGRYLYVPSWPSGIGHSFAFGPQPPVGPPVIESVSFAEVTRTEAELHATINPEGLSTEYAFEYTTKQSFEENGFAGAGNAGEGTIAAGSLGVSISSSVSGLSPNTTYRFRVVAKNQCEPSGCSDVGEGEFTTYPAAEPKLPCPNDVFRTEYSALLPDCRAYELVTPPNTNARSPSGVKQLGLFFATKESSPAGDKVPFYVEGGSIPGLEGTGSLAGDPYLATRTPSGWKTASTGPTGAEASVLLPGSTSPDQGYSFWQAEGEGSALIEEGPADYLRYPDGHSELIGQGSLGTAPQVEGKLISEGGSHVVFVSGGSFPAVQLEPNAPPSGTWTIYDRTANEITHVVSLLPGDVTPAAGENALYQGASLDGKGIAFKLGGTLYFRYNDENTYEVGNGVTFAGFSADGRRVFYLEGGDLFAFDIGEEERIQFSSSGDVTPVNVAAAGRVAYLASPSILTGEPNPEGAAPVKGQQNLYRSEEGAISFVGTVTEEDVEGKETGIGLGLWAPHVVSFGEAGEDPSRTTSDGNVLLFESRAALSSYDPEGHIEVYRYDVKSNELDCLSCNPTGVPATSDASLESMGFFLDSPAPFSYFASVANLRGDGRRAFFQSDEPLVVGDTDGLQDVYEWEAQGVGSCKREGGCIFLVSSGHSKRIDYLYAVSDSGDDVFVRTSDLLLGIDADATPSIYDARVGGGFPEAAEEECLAEGCRPGLTPPPSLPTAGQPALGARDNVSAAKHCPKGEHRVSRKGKTRCVKKPKRHHRRKANTKSKGAGK